MHTKITKGEVFEFVKKELVPANNTRVECADGRYLPEQSQGAIRAFGGDFGFVLAFAGALKSEGTFLDPAEIVERYYRAIRQFRGENARLYYHTDEHNHIEGKIGCGHAAQAANPDNEGKYGISSNEAKILYETFAKHQSSNVTILEGRHKEKGVLVIDGTSHSMNSRAKDNMFFVITPKAIDSLIDLLAPIFSRGLTVPVDPNDVKASYIKQQKATSELLGADKLPMFRVGFNSKGHFIMEEGPSKKSKRSS